MASLGVRSDARSVVAAQRLNLVARQRKLDTGLPAIIAGIVKG